MDYSLFGQRESRDIEVNRMERSRMDEENDRYIDGWLANEDEVSVHGSLIED